MYERDEDRPRDGMLRPNEVRQDQDGDESYQSIETASEDKIVTEDLPSVGEHDEIDEGDLDQGNIISTVKMDAFKLKRQLPGDINQVKNMHAGQAEIIVSEESDADDYRL